MDGPLPGVIVPGLLLAAASILSSCEGPGTPVVLNERLFDLPAMTSAGEGCTMYELRQPSLFSGGGSSSSGGGSANGLPLVVGQRSADDRVVVDVTDNGRVVVERIYDESFFRSGKVDEFTATTLGETMLLRYWGATDPNGHPQCAPFTDDGSRPPSP
jgi:hypothetical protein